MLRARGGGGAALRFEAGGGVPFGDGSGGGDLGSFVILALDVRNKCLD
jgi:hypothetical protein